MIDLPNCPDSFVSGEADSDDSTQRLGLLERTRDLEESLPPAVPV